MKNRLYTIQEVANILGVSTKTLRRWDQRGSFVPTRTAGNQRRYTQEQVSNFKSQASKPKGSVKVKSNIPQGEPFFKPQTPKEFKPAQGLPSALNSLPSNSFLKHHFLLKSKATFSSHERGTGELAESSSPSEGEVMLVVAPAKRVSAFKIGLMFAGLVIILSFTGAVAMTKYNLVTGIAQKKEQFVKFIANLPQISISIKPNDLSLALQEDQARLLASERSDGGQAVLAATAGDADLILNVNVPAFFSQSVGIGATTVDPSAMLDLTSEEKGFLAPRMTEVQIQAITEPAAGLFVYNTDTNHYNLYDGTAWQGIFNSIGDSTLGEAFTKTGTEGNSLYFHGTGGGNTQVTSGASSGTSNVLTFPDTTGTFVTTGNLTAINKVGTISTGVWNGTVLTVPYGGTGVSTLTGIVLGNGTGVMTGLTTSAGIAGVIGDETGTGLMVFNTDPVFDGDMTPTTTLTSNLGSALLYWNNVYAANFIAGTTGTAGYWQRNNNAISPTNISDDVLIGSTSTASAKFGFINIASGIPTATISGNLSLAVGTDNATMAALNLFNNSSLNIQRSPGGDAGLASTMFFQSNGNVGIGTTAPSNVGLDIVGSNAKVRIHDYQSNADAGNFEMFKARGTEASPQAVQNGDLLGVMGFLGYDGNSYQYTGYIESYVAGAVSDENIPGDLRFSTNPTDGSLERMRITSAGNVGIGNTTPLAALDVTGSASLSADLSLRGAGTNHLFNILQNGTLNFQRSAGGDAGLTSAMFIQGNGNVGIGTTAPGYKLDVNGDLTADKIYLSSTAYFDDTVPASFLNGSVAGTSYGQTQLTLDAGDSGIPLTLIADNSAYSPRYLSVKDSSTPGSPTENFYIGRGTNANDAYVYLGAGAPELVFGTQGEITTNSYAGTLDGMTIYPANGLNVKLNTNKSVLFETNNGTTGEIRISEFVDLRPELDSDVDLGASSYYWKNTYTDSLYLNSTAHLDGATAGAVSITGNVGIGNTTPLAALDITGSASLSADLSLRGQATNHLFNILNDGTLNIQRSAGGDAGLTSAMFIQSNGNVGIGTTNPLSRLDVNGGAAIGSYAGTNAAPASGLIVSGNVGIKTATPDSFALEVGGDVGPTVGSTYDLGSSSRRWDNVYGVTANFTNFSTTEATISGTTTQDFLINSDNVTNDTENASLSFSRGTGNTNSQFLWNSVTKQLSTNSTSFAILPDPTIAYSGTSAFMVNQVQNQDIMTASASGVTKFVINNAGNVGIGVTNPASFMLQTAGNIGPNADSTYDLGSSSLAWRNIYADNFVTTATTGYNGWFQRNAQALSPTNITDDVLIGGISTSSAIIRLAGTNVGGANLLDVFNSGSSVFSVSSTGITNNLPTSFTAAGDVSMAYDLQFTNPTASYIKSYAPLYIQSGDPSQNLDLTLSAAGTGNVVVNDTFLVQDTTDSTTAYQFASSSGTILFNVDTLNGRVGIGNTVPLTAFDLTGSASISANQSFGGAGTAHTFNILDNGTLNFQRSPGGDAGLTSALFIQNNGNIGIGVTNPAAMLSIGSSTPVLVSSAGLITVANTTDSTTGSTGSINTLGGLGVTKDLAVDGGDIVTAATTFNLLNTTATTMNFAGAAATLSIGAATGTVTLNNATTAITGALTANGDVTLGNAITDNITFTGRVAVDSDLIPIGTTGTNDLGSLTLPWDNLYVDNIYSPSSGTSGYWQRNSGALSPTNITDDFLLGATSTSSAKFGLINIAGGNPTATISSNLSLIVPTGNAPAATFNLLNNGSLNFQRSAGGDAGLTSAMFIQGDGNVGIGTTNPASRLDVGGTRDYEYITIQGTKQAAMRILSDNDGSGINDAWLQMDIGTGADRKSWYMGSDAGDSAKLKIGYRAAAGGQPGDGDKLTITTAGDIGIGTTAPGGTLDITSGVTTGKALSINAASLTSGYALNIVSTRATPGAGGGGTMVISDTSVKTSSGDGDHQVVYSSAIIGAGNNSNNWTGTASPQIKPFEGAITFTTPSSGSYTVGKAAVFTSGPGMQVNSGVTVTDLAGFYFDNPAATGGTLTNLYGMYLEQPTRGSNNWALYSAGGNNYFGGNVGIGTTTPTALLDVGGTASVSALTIRGSSPGYINQINGNDLIFRTSPGGDAGLTERMTILNNGNVGIGTTAPGRLLDVNGVSRFRDEMYFGPTDNIGLVSWSGNDFIVKAASGNSLSLGSNGTAGKMYIAASGNVGIGTTAPVGVLQVNGIAGGNAAMIVNNAGTFGDIFTASSSGTARFVITNAGNVGIGNNLPGSLLSLANNGWFSAASTQSGQTTNMFKVNTADQIQVGASLSVDGSLVFPTDAGYVTAMDLGLSSAQAANTANGYVFRLGTANVMTVYGENNGSGVLQNGRVGIGNTSPLTALDVTGSASLSANQSFKGAGTAHTFNILDNGTLNIQRSPGGDAGLATALFVQNNGNIGVGTTAPTSKLHVYTNANATDASITAESDGTNSDAVLNLDAYRYPTMNFRIQGALKSQFVEYGTRTAFFVNEGNTEALSILQASGNVGIGTTTPLTKLDITGSASLSADLSLRGQATNHLFNILNNGTLNIQRSAGGDAGLTSAMFIQSNGNVGIGTTAPAYKLEVNGTLYAGNTAKLANDLYVYNAVRLTDSDLTTVQGRMYAASGKFYLGQGNNNHVTIDSSGNVGIGLTAPNSKLSVLATGTGIGAGAGISLHSSADTSTVDRFRMFLGDGTGGYLDRDVYIQQQNVDLHLQGGADGQVENVMIKANGNVGIGTTTPLTKLDVEGSASLSADLSLRGASTAHLFNILDNGTLNIQRSPGGDAGLATALYVGSGGNVGIGTTAPGAKLAFVAGTTAAGGIDFGTDTNLYRSGANGLKTDDYLYVGELITLRSTGLAIVNGLNVTTNADIGGADTNYLSVDAASATSGDTLKTSGQLRVRAEYWDGGASQGLIGSIKQVMTATTPTGYMSFTSGAAANAMVIQNNGNVGIGTTSPLAALDVRGTSGTAPAASVSAQTSFASMIVDNSGIGDLFTASKSGAPKFVITNAGNVGIGTTTPGYKLDVNGTLNVSAGGAGYARIVPSASNAYMQLYYNSGSWLELIPNETSANIGFRTATGPLRFGASDGAGNLSSEFMRIAANGNVGIGTTAPLAKLQSNSTYTSQLWGTSYWTQSGLDGYDGTKVNDGNTATIGFYTDSSAAGSYLHLDAGSGNAKEFTRLDITARGADTVNFTFNVQYSDNDSSWTTAYTGGGGHPFAGTNSSTWGNVGSHRYWRLYKTDVAAGGGYTTEVQFYERPAMFFASNDSGTQFVVDNLGNVGIGTTTPLTKLDVTGSASLSADLSLRGQATNHLFNILNNGTLNIQRSAGGDAGLASSLFIQNNGNIGIGTTAPISRLQVSTATNATQMTLGSATGVAFSVVKADEGYGLYAGVAGSGDSWLQAGRTSTDQAYNLTLQASGGNVGIGNTNPASFMLQTAGNIGPNADSTYDLGSSSLAWRNIYADNFVTTATTGYNGWFQRNAQALSPTNITDDVLIGGISTSSAIIRLAGTNVGGANLLDVFNSGSSVFSVSSTGITNNLPTSFTAPGDVSMAYDLQFTNPTASYIKSYAPLYIQSGDSSQNLDLNLSAAGTGNVVVNDTFLAQNTTDSTTAYQFASSSGTIIFNVDTYNGRVGIGQTTPITALDIVGSASLSANLSFGGAATAHTFNILQNGTLNIQRSPGGDAGLASVIFVQNNGNVGIGTTAPTQSLHVYRSTSNIGTIVETAANGLAFTNFVNTQNTGRIGVEDSGGGNYATGALAGSFGVYSTGAKALQFGTNGTVKMTVLSDGSVGIGTTAPSALFSISDGTNKLVDAVDLGTSGEIRMGLGAWTTNYMKLNKDVLQFDPAGGPHYIQGGGGDTLYIQGNPVVTNTYARDIIFQGLNTATDTRITSLVVQGSTGYVGIGNTTPLTALDVTGSASLSADLSLRGAGTPHTFNILDNGTLNIQRSPGGDAGLATALFIQNNGNIGVGTTAPTMKFQIGATDGASVFTGMHIVNGSGGFYLGTNENKTFFDAGRNGVYDLTLDGTGNVGIGTTAPGALLTLANNGWFGGISTASGTTNMFKVNTADQIQVGAALNIDGSFNLPADGGYVTAMNMPMLSAGTGVASGYVFRMGSSNIMTIYGENSSGVLANGRVGIGITTPLYRLDVRDSQAATAAAQIFNTSTNADADGLIIKLGFTGAGTATNAFTTYMNGNGLIQGLVKSNAASGVTYQTNGVADFAEYFKKDSSSNIPFGSVVCLGDDGLAVSCNPSAGSGQSKIIGVASEYPAFLGGENFGDRSVPVGLVGQVRTRVSTANGEIKIGDPLTTSGTAGVAVKATSTGQILGKAIEGFNGSGEGTIMVSVNISWYNPSIYVSYDGTLAGMATTVTSIGDQLTLQGEALQAQLALQGETLQAQIDSIATQSAQVDYVLATDPLFDSLNNKVADLQSKLDLLSLKVEQQASISAFLTEIQNGQVLGVSTASAELITSLGDIEINSATIAEDFMVLGRTTVTDLGVTGNINAGLLAINGLDGEMNTLSGDLKLQSQGLGGVDILNGKVMIDTAGNMTVAGHIYAGALDVAGTVAATDYTVVGNQSIGSGIIPVGSTSIEIFTSVASLDSKIFLTSTSLTDKQITVVKKSNGKFKVAIPTVSTVPVTFDWWIVGNK